MGYTRDYGFSPEKPLIYTDIDGGRSWVRESIKRNLDAFCRIVGLDPLTISSVADLGPGMGGQTLAILDTFPNATVHVIDYHDYIMPEVKASGRVKFYQGLFTEVLASGVIPPCEVVQMRNTGTPGFDRDNIHTLARAVGRGHLLLTYDNGLLTRNDSLSKSMYGFGWYFRPVCIDEDAISMGFDIGGEEGGGIYVVDAVFDCPLLPSGSE